MASSTPSDQKYVLLRVPALRELIGMPFEGTVSDIADGLGRRCIVLEEVGTPEPPDEDGLVVVQVDEGHLLRAYQVVKVPYHEEESAHLRSCEANIHYWCSIDRAADALEGVFRALTDREGILARTCKQLELFNQSRQLEMEENRRLALMPLGGLKP